jgi:molybdenum cofactor synthesis domain-containing protein
MDKQIDGSCLRVAIITLSDKGSQGEREDVSGKKIIDFITEMNGIIVTYEVIPDEADELKNLLMSLADGSHANLILTTGGTGLSPRDITPEVTLSVADKIVPGFAEAMRMESLKKTPHAMLSRAATVMRKETLIINLPGNPAGVIECLEVIAPALPHAIQKAGGDPADCGE